MDYQTAGYHGHRHHRDIRLNKKVNLRVYRLQKSPASLINVLAGALR